MIKVKHDLRNAGIDYPVIAIGKNTGCVVAFTRETTGVVLSSGNSKLIQFNKYNDLLSIKSSRWKILGKSESITLCNW